MIDEMGGRGVTVQAPLAPMVVSFTAITIGAVATGVGLWSFGLLLILAGTAFAIVASLRWRRRTRARVGNPPWNIEFPAWTKSTVKVWLAASLTGAAGLLIVVAVAALAGRF